MVLDEPTNDLDAETLELLEELVSDYDGTMLLVTHDRAFLNNVVTSTLALQGDGHVHEYAGGYDDYVRQKAEEQSAADSDAKVETKAKPEPPRKAAKSANKLTFKERQELQRLPGRIHELEEQQAELHAAMADPAFFKQDGAQIAETTNRVKQLEAELSDAYARWEELEERE